MSSSVQKKTKTKYAYSAVSILFLSMLGSATSNALPWLEEVIVPKKIDIWCLLGNICIS